MGAAVRLNKKTCEDLASRPFPAGGKPVTHWDEDLPGFGARRTAGSLTFVLKYRVKGDPKQRWIKLGTWPTTNPDRARDEARRIRVEADFGRDLVAERQADDLAAAEQARDAVLRARPLAAMLDSWRSQTEAEIARKEAARRLPTYERELLRIEATLLRPAVGSLSVGELGGERLQALISAEARRSPSNARMLRAVIVRFARLANDAFALEGVPLRLPVAYELRLRGRIRSRDHRYSLDEAAALWTAAGEMGRRGALVRFMLLTACRRIEAQRVEWSHLVFEHPDRGPLWEQPAHLTKNGLPHQVPLAPAAVALLRWLPPRETKPSGRAALVFAGRGNKPVAGWTDVRRELLRRAGVGDGTLHDIRRTVVSTLGDQGFDPQVADTLLNHAAAGTLSGVMAVYQRSEFWGKRREAIERWAELLLERVAERTKTPLDRESWGFSAPFAEVRFRRPKPQGQPDSPAGSTPSRPRSRTPGTGRAADPRPAPAGRR